MASKFSQFLEQNSIDPRRVRATSRRLERLRPEDRKERLARRRAQSAEGAAKSEAPTGKLRSGRPVTERLLREATEGKPVSGPAKTRVLRAINHILEQKKKPAIDLRALF
jgi:hypothetical protein